MNRKNNQPDKEGSEKVNRLVILPSLVTLANALVGLMAVGETFKAIQDSSVMHLRNAAWFILAAMVFDALDGKIARLTGASSSFGVELDSLSDAVSFGIAPAMLVFASILRLREAGGPHPFLERLSFPISALYVFCVLVRLARFNVEKDPEAKEHGDFVGLPTPAAAGAVASGFLMSMTLMETIYAKPLNFEQAVQTYPLKAVLQIAPWVVFTLSILMISRIRYSHMMSRVFSKETSFRYTMTFIVCVVLLIIYPELSLALIFFIYLGSGPLNALREMLINVASAPDGG